ncbi:hypothetical protein [Bradyrhizobium sp. 195]|uniref:hypothetical protein n=1 Tax=Bradyrhizobium sp. 195 TaxID=2782662 RepID=UPI002000B4CF|nr:hypothetical protein [Bradyrhizobium sp. 195]UPK23857.1 hypothetical protein IVB26_20885 [Bradyrhizobium sp. 195]
MNSEAGEPRISHSRLNALNAQGVPRLQDRAAVQRVDAGAMAPARHGRRLPLFGSDSLCASAPQDVCDLLRGVAVKVHGDLDRTFQLLPALRRRRRFGVAACRPCPRAVRAAGGLNEDIASRHAAFLHNVLNRKLGAAARVEFSDDRTFQGRTPWVDESANNRRARAWFLGLADPQLSSNGCPRSTSEPDHPEQEQQRDCDQAGDQQRAETPEPVREEEEHALPAVNVLRGNFSGSTPFLVCDLVWTGVSQIHG